MTNSASTAITDQARKVANLVPVDITPHDSDLIADAVSAVWEGEIEALRDVLLAFSFHVTGLRTPEWDPIYTAVGSLTNEQQDVLRGVLNPAQNGSTPSR